MKLAHSFYSAFVALKFPMRKRAVAACFRGASFVCIRVLPILLAGVMFVACGTQLQVESVDAGQRASFDNVVAGLDALGYAGLIVEAKTEKAVSIVTDTVRVQERNEAKADNEATALAFYSYTENKIVMVETGVWVSSVNGRGEISVNTRTANVILAHELGHALGLDHTETGLMQPNIAIGCLDRAAECLVEALKATGKL